MMLLRTVPSVAALLAPALLSTPALALAPQDDSPIADSLTRADAAVEAICAIPDDARTYDNTVRAIDDVAAILFEETRMLGFMADVSMDGEERSRGRRAGDDLSNWFDSLSRHAGLYHAVTAYAATGPELGAEAAMFLSDTLRDFKRAGMELEAESRARLAELDEELTELGSEFRQNIAEDETTILLTREELAGVPESFLATLDQDRGLYFLEMKGQAPSMVLGYCENPVTRRRFGATMSLRGGKKNVNLLERILKLRHEKAQLLGYANIAEYVTEDRMSGSPERVMAFYEDLRPKLRAKAEQDFAEFEAAKREHTGDADARFEATDFSFYSNWLMRERYAVDTQVLREYLPLDQVLGGMFGVYQDLFGVRFVEITDEARAAGRPFWHPDVRLFETREASTGELLGEFYIDLFPRLGKFSHAAQFPLRLRKQWADGRLSRPLVALVCNFTKPTETAPSLLSHGEVETLFHEFGHCLHSLLTEAELASLAGTAVARDFVEAPSQMLENWVWQPAVLARFARHHETGAPLPSEVIDGMIAAKNLGSGLATEGQVFLGLMDMRFHTDEDGLVNTTQVRLETYRDTRMFEPMRGLYSQASFGHLVGYEAGYYGYLWSLVFAQDMWSRFAASPMDPEVAREYRAKVLSRGGTVPELDMVRDFLGREPNAAAFLEHLGLDAEPVK